MNSVSGIARGGASKVFEHQKTTGEFHLQILRPGNDSWPFSVIGAKFAHYKRAACRLLWAIRHLLLFLSWLSGAVDIVSACIEQNSFNLDLTRLLSCSSRCAVNVPQRMPRDRRTKAQRRRQAFRANNPGYEAPSDATRGRRKATSGMVA